MRLGGGGGPDYRADSMTDIDRYPHGIFCWVDLTAHDMDAAKAWYADLFGWDVEDQDTQGGPPYAMFTMRGRVVAGIGQMSDEMKGAGVPPLWNSYVNVDDADAIAKKVPELGGQIMVPAMDVMDAGRLAYFMDPEGASFAVWQAKAHHGSQVVDEPGAFCWNELATRDPAKAQDFYGELFGWTGKEEAMGDTSYTTISMGDRVNAGMLKMNEKWGELPSHWMVYFAVQDIGRAVAKIKETAGQIMVEPVEIPVGTFAVATDPQGGNFSVIELKNGQA